MPQLQRWTKNYKRLFGRSLQHTEANNTLLMDIAFDEPTGTSDQGFGFATESSVDAVDAGFGFGGSSSGISDDLGLGGFADAPAPAPAPAPESFDLPAAQSYSPPAPIAAAPAPAASLFAAPEAENPLTIWEAQHKIHLKEKAEKEKVNNDKMRKDADAWLKQFSDERKKNHDVKHKDNQCVIFSVIAHATFLFPFLFCVCALPKSFAFFSEDLSCLICAIRANETAFKQEVEKIYTTGPTWTRVNSLVDLQQKTDRKDVGRMKVCCWHVANRCCM
jgi:hypothetical protein